MLNNGKENCEDFDITEVFDDSQACDDNNDTNLSQSINDDKDNSNPYIDFDSNLFSPLFLYRPAHDVIGSLIVNSRSEGAGRYELGRKIGLSTRIKSGNRRVSGYIQSVLKAYPDYIGQYQKMEGKYRTIKYFLKDSEPEKHMSMLRKFKELTGVECPFKFGEVLKFPNTKLNTLRISDITMKRMIYILEVLKKEKFVLTHIKMVRYIQQRDTEEGYPFRIDKKSASKCILALEKHGFCRTFITEIEEDNVKRPFEIITVREITSVDDESIQAAIVKAREEFAANNKVFPTGAPRPFKKPEEFSKLRITPKAQKDNPTLRLETRLSRKRSSKQNEENDAEHYEFLKTVLKQKRVLPTASEKTISSLAAGYKRHKFMAARTSKKNKSTPSLSGNDSATISANDNSVEQFSSLSSGEKNIPDTMGFDVNADSSAISDREFSAVMDSAAMANIKQEVVNAINGNGVGTSAGATEQDQSTKRKRRSKKATEVDAVIEVTPVKKKKKKALDEIDIMSQNRKVFMRSRFTPREKDMLILIRSVSFFLNPIHRFWLDPSVMRNIMHEYVPESRCKTANSLMAAGNRDLSRATRMAHLQYIVKTLSSYNEMREIRNRLPYINMQSGDAKAKIFLTAFKTAYNLLFRESQSFPTIRATDSDFDAYIAENKLQITSTQEQDEICAENTSYNSDFPQRSLMPSSVNEAKHCIVFNIIMSVMLHDMLAKNENALKGDSETFTKNDTELSFLHGSFIKQMGSKEFSNSLEILHRDGLISKIRSTDRIPSCELLDAEPALIFKNQIMCSIFYRHFFNHHFHTEIVSLTKDAVIRYQEVKIDETDANDPGSVLLLSEFLTSNEVDINFSVPSSMKNLFVSNEEKNSSSAATKQLRYLENADLHIDLIKIHPVNFSKIVQTNLPDFEKTISSLTYKVPHGELKRASIKELSDVIGKINKCNREDATIVYQAIEKASVVGISEEELVSTTQLEPLRLKKIINLLLSSFDIFPGGIDTRRYVLMRNANCWLVCNDDFGFFPRPWSRPSGDVNCLLLRWMSEAILVMVHKKPGILIQELVSTFAFVIQPIIVEEILCLLETIGCCHICAKPMKSMYKTSDGHRAQRNDVRYAMPVHNSLVLFAMFFKDFVNF